MHSPIRYGVIGTGMMGCEHIRNIAQIPDAVVSAVADPNAESLRWARLALGDAADASQAYSDPREMIARAPLDAVVIASPNFTHAEVLEPIFETDLHVLVEKPMCTTLDDCLRVCERAETHAGVFWVGLEYRYMAPATALLAELRAGAVGQLRMLFIREHRFPFLPKVGDWNRFNRNTGGTLVEKCCHFFDLMNLAVGTQPLRVLASGGQDVNHLDERYAGETPDILDNAFVIVEYEGGARACLDLCMFAEASRHEQEIVATGDAGKLECTVPGDALVIATRDPRGVRSEPIAQDPRVAHSGLHHGASYLEHLEFIESIRQGRPAVVGAREGLRSVALGIAAHRSIEEGRAVAMQELGAL